jgi:hypothetical protein
MRWRCPSLPLLMAARTMPPDPDEAMMSRKREPSLEDIDEAKTGLWVEQELNRVRQFLVEQGGDKEMLDVVDFSDRGERRDLARSADCR